MHTGEWAKLNHNDFIATNLNELKAHEEICDHKYCVTNPQGSDKILYSIRAEVFGITSQIYIEPEHLMSVTQRLGFRFEGWDYDTQSHIIKTRQPLFKGLEGPVQWPHSQDPDRRVVVGYNCKPVTAANTFSGPPTVTPYIEYMDHEGGYNYRPFNQLGNPEDLEEFVDDAESMGMDYVANGKTVFDLDGYRMTAPLFDKLDHPILLRDKDGWIIHYTDPEVQRHRDEMLGGFPYDEVIE